MLQNWLNLNSEYLLNSEIAISLSSHIVDSPFEKFCFQYSKPTRPTVTVAQARSFIFDRTNVMGDTRVHIISKENILGEAGRLYRNSFDVMRYLREVFQNIPVKFVFYIRRIDNFIESHVLQQFAHGNTVSVEEVFESIGSRTWSDVVQSMEAHFPNSVHVDFYERIFEGTDRFICRFCVAAEIDTVDISRTVIPSERYQNRSISAPGLTDLMRNWNTLSTEDRILLFNVIRKNHNTSAEAKPSILTSTQRMHIRNKHKQSDEYIIKKYSNNDKFLQNYYFEDL